MRRIERHPIVSEQAWLDLRRHDVTASVIGALFGVHPYETIYGLAARISGMQLSEPRDNTVMARGRELQELVGRYVQRRHPTWKVRAANVYLRDPQRRLGASPDFFVRADGQRGIVEAKTVATAMFARRWNNGVPPWIAFQALTCAILARAHFAVVAALVLDPWKPPELHEYNVPRHPKAERRLLAGVEQFWARIDAGQIPDPDYARDSGLLAAMYPHAVAGKRVDLTGDNRIPELLAEREKLIDEMDKTKTRREEIETEIKAKIGDAEIADVNGWHVTLKEIHKREYVAKATSYRQLRATRERDNESEAAA